MRSRCLIRTNPAYENYGGRGIKIYSKWEEFKEFKEWADSSGYTDKLTIDRIDVNGNYCPENCRWVSRKVQGNNKRNNDYLTYKGVTKTRQEWSKQLNIEIDHLKYLLKKFDHDITFIIEEMISKGYKQAKYQHIRKWKELYKEYKNK